MHVTRTICCKLAADGQVTTPAATQRAINAAATAGGRGVGGGGPRQRDPGASSGVRRGAGAVRPGGAAGQLRARVDGQGQEAGTPPRPRFGPCGSVRYDARSYTLLGRERVSL